MSFKNKLVSIVTLAIAVAAFSTIAAAQESAVPAPKDSKMGQKYGERRGKMRGMHGGGMILRELRGIELTETQKTQIKGLMESHKASFATNREEMRTLMEKKRSGTLTEADTARLKQFHDEMKASSEQLRNSVMALLTPEQTAKLEKIRAERKQRMEERKLRMKEWKQREKAPETPKSDN